MAIQLDLYFFFDISDQVKDTNRAHLVSCKTLIYVGNSQEIVYAKCIAKGGVAFFDLHNLARKFSSVLAESDSNKFGGGNCFPT